MKRIKPEMEALLVAAVGPGHTLVGNDELYKPANQRDEKERKPAAKHDVFSGSDVLDHARLWNRPNQRDDENLAQYGYLLYLPT